jgi:hypothetical protein
MPANTSEQQFYEEYGCAAECMYRHEMLVCWCVLHKGMLNWLGKAIVLCMWKRMQIEDALSVHACMHASFGTAPHAR